MRSRSHAGLALVLAALLVAGCATTPNASFYALEAPPPGGAADAGGLSEISLALGPIDLPEYLDRPQIVTRSGGNRLSVDEFNRWGGSLEEEIGRVLAARLGQRLGTERIYGYPSRVVARTDYRIALDVRGFDGALGGSVRLDLAWSLVDDATGRVLQTRRTVYEARASAGDYAAYAAALSATLVQLGDELAAAVRGVAASR